MEEPCSIKTETAASFTASLPRSCFPGLALGACDRVTCPRGLGASQAPLSITSSWEVDSQLVWMGNPTGEKQLSPLRQSYPAALARCKGKKGPKQRSHPGHIKQPAARGRQNHCPFPNNNHAVSTIISNLTACSVSQETGGKC